MRIRVDDLTSPSVQALVRLHLEGLHDLSPPESTHTYGLERLRDPGVTVWSAWEGRSSRPGQSSWEGRSSRPGQSSWEGETLLGIGALQVLPGSTEGEIKSMRTDPAHLGRGVGRAILRHIIGAARSRCLDRLSLETGTGEAFAPAHRLYLSEGFVPCGPFGAYRPDPHSRFFTLALEAADGGGG